MSVRRRGLLLSAAFCALALWLCPGTRAQAQFQPQGPQPGRHTIWQSQLSADDVRQLLGQFGQGDTNADRLLKDLIRDRVNQTNPGADRKQVDAAIDRLLKDKAFRDRLTDLAQKNKNRNPDAGDNLQLTPQDIERLKSLRPNVNGGNPNGGNPNGKPGSGGDPFKLPPPDPKSLPPFDPDTFDPRNFDPDKFPAADPRNPPKIDPDSRLPIDPKTDRPFDPRTGEPLDPRTGRPPEPQTPPQPKVDPKDPDPIFRPRPKAEPEPKKLPPDDPQNPAPPPGPNDGPPDDPRKFDRDNPFGKPKESPQSKVAATATALWEKNVGPIDESPAVKRAIYELINDPEAMDALTDGKGNNLFDLFRDMGGSGGKDLFGGGGKGWEWPKLPELKLNLGSGSSRPSADLGSGSGRSRWFGGSGGGSGPGRFGGMGSFNLGGMQVPWLLFLILALVVVAAVVWWKWDQIVRAAGRRRPAAADGLGPWPVDPRNIGSREDVVKAFEYLSVLICGPAARTWTHSTVADELTHLARTNGPAALKLARLYELARYAPLDEPLSRAELVEARRLVCDLAELD